MDASEKWPLASKLDKEGKIVLCSGDGRCWHWLGRETAAKGLCWTGRVAVRAMVDWSFRSQCGRLGKRKNEVKEEEQLVEESIKSSQATCSFVELPHSGSNAEVNN